MGWFGHPKFFFSFFFSIFFKKFLILSFSFSFFKVLLFFKFLLTFKVFYFLFFFFFLHNDTCLLSGVDMCLTISFWIEKLTEAPISSFPKPHVPSVNL
jgi:hypothetical protein